MEIAVIIPVYQAGKYLSRCVESIRIQSFNDIELLLVDDGSWDCSPALCDEYAAENSNMIVFHKGNGGASTARNAGIEYSQFSDFNLLSFIDADDWIHKDYFKLLYEAVITNHSKISMCNAVDTADENFDFPENCNIEILERSPEELWCENRNLCVVPWGKLFSKSLFKDIRFPEGKIKEDEYVSYQVLFQCKKIAYCEEGLYAYFQSPNSVMRSRWSLKELDDMDALDGQVDFFYKKGYRNACVISARENIFSLSQYIMQLKKHKKDPDIKKLCVEVKKRRKKNIKYFHSVIKIPIDGNEWVYALVYPYRMKCFRLLKRVLKKEGC